MKQIMTITTTIFNNKYIKLHIFHDFAFTHCMITAKENEIYFNK